MTAPLFIDAARLEQALPVEQAVAALAAGFASSPLPQAPTRSHLTLGDGELLLMPAHGEQGTGVKLVTICRANQGRGLPLLHGMFALFSPETFALEAIVDGSALTALRTAAVSALATRLLAAEQAERLVIFGAGRQAHAHLHAMRAVRPIRSLGVVEPEPARATALLGAARAAGIEAEVVAPDAVAEADVICTCTTSTTPVLDGTRVAAGAHVNAMGAYRPQDRELDSALMARARIVVETREAALAEAGDLLIPIANGELDADDIVADLSEVVAGRPVRRADGDITVFESVGVAFEDLIVARAACASVREGEAALLGEPSA